MYLTGAGKTKKMNKCGTKRGRNGKNKSPRKLGESEETGKTKLFQQD